MKHSFLRLISSFYILLISALMIVISAYAWMVISDSPAAGGIGFGIAGLEQWGIPEAEYKEPDKDAYDYMDEIRWTAADVAADTENLIFQKDENDTYIIDSAEKFVAVMEYVNGNTAFKGPLKMRLTTHISLEDHKMQSQTVEIATLAETLENGETETSETQEMITETVEVFWKADEWKPVKVEGYTGTGCITIEVDPTLTQQAKDTGLNATAYIKGLAKPLFNGGFAGNSGIVINDVTIYDSHMMSTSNTGSGAFIEYVDSMPTITLKNCHLIASSIDKDRTDNQYSRVGGLIGWTSGYNKQNDGPVKTYITVENCSVQGCTLLGTSVGGINGHAGANAWTYTTIKNCTVTDNELHSLDDGEWRVGEIVGTANVGQVTIIDAITENNVRIQTGKTEPKDRPSLYGRASIGSTGSLMILDNNATDGYGEAYVIGEFIPEKEQALTTANQHWYIHGAVKLKEEVRFNGKSITVMSYMTSDASITFDSVATGLSYPGSPNASAGFNFAETDGYTTEDMDKVRAEKGSEINFTNIKFINNKTLGDVATNVASRRHPICMYALADTARYEDCIFDGSLVVYNSATFKGCTFTEDEANRFCLFLDDVYDAEYGEYLIQDCTFTAASTAYGCVKISEDGSLNYKDTNGYADDVFVGGKYTIHNSKFTNATDKPAVYVNGFAEVITIGQNTIIDNRENWAERKGGILAKNLGTEAEPMAYATYNGVKFLTVYEYDHADEAKKAEYDQTEVGVNGNGTDQSTLNEGNESSETESTAETTGESTSETVSMEETTGESTSETVSTEETTGESTSETVSTEETTSESTSETVSTEETTGESTEETTTPEAVSSDIESTAENASENVESEEIPNENTETEEIASESEAEETEPVDSSAEENLNEENPSSEIDSETSSSESSSEEENAV